MGAGHDRQRQGEIHSLVVEENYEEDNYDESQDFQRLDLMDTHDFESPIDENMGVMENDISVYLYKEINGSPIFESVEMLVGYAVTNNETRLVTKINEEFAELDVKNSDRTDIIDYLGEFGEAEIFNIYEELSAELDNLEFYQEELKKGIDYVAAEDIKKSIASVLKHTNQLSDYMNTNFDKSIKYIDNILSIVSKTKTDINEMDTAPLGNLMKSITANLVEVFEQLDDTIKIEHWALSEKLYDASAEIMTETIISNPTNTFSLSTGSYTSGNVLYLGDEKSVLEFISKEEDRSKETGLEIDEYRAGKFQEIKDEIAYFQKKKEEAEKVKTERMKSQKK